MAAIERIPRAYVDTSVFGGILDHEFASSSSHFFQRIRAGELNLVISSVIRKEIENAPVPVQEFYRVIAPLGEVIDITEAAIQLSQEYLRIGVVGERWKDDALHVALATVANCTMIVSWNFKHIVNYRKMHRYNAVNALFGYNKIDIYSPLEVATDEE